MKELKFGETPWDNLPREELLREVQKMYAVIGALNSVVSQSRRPEAEQHPYWGAEGTGGRALEMANQVLTPITEKYEAENIYRSFYRYAYDLLFDQSKAKIGFGWVVCPECGVMFGKDTKGHSHEGENCSSVGMSNKPDCQGVFRKIEWSDLDPDRWNGDAV